MFTLSSFMLFIGTAILLILVPGPDLIFAVTQGLRGGKRAGVVTALGLSLGNTVHTLAAALGLSVIIQTSAVLFNIFKIAGAVYLFYLAIQSFRHRKASIELAAHEAVNLKKLLIKGMTMNVLNPKVALFYLTFLPQFVNYEYGKVPVQMLILGLTFLVLTAIIFSLLAYFAGIFQERLLNKPRFGEAANLAGAFVFAGLGIKMLTTEAS